MVDLGVGRRLKVSSRTCFVRSGTFTFAAYNSTHSPAAGWPYVVDLGVGRGLAVCGRFGRWPQDKITI